MIKKIKVKCEYCRNILFRNPYRIKRNKHHFCDINCKNNFPMPQEQREKISKIHINKIKVKCVFCKKEIERIPSRIKKCVNNFCNRQCKGKWMSKYLLGKNSPAYGKTPWIKGKTKYNNKKVANISRLKKGVPRPKEVIAKVIKTKKRLYKEGKIKVWNKDYGDYILGDKNPNWKGGASFEKYSIGFNDILKRKVRMRDGFFCQYCWTPEEILGKNMDSHHIDYDKNHNIKNNLISLCPICHGKMHYNRIYWQSFWKNKILEKNLNTIFWAYYIPNGFNSIHWNDFILK